MIHHYAGFTIVLDTGLHEYEMQKGHLPKKKRSPAAFPFTKF
jgi:hypothetical protein